MKTPFFLVLLAAFLAAVPVSAAERIISPGDYFPDYQFSKAISAADAAYLSVTEQVSRKGYFQAEDVWGEVLVVELFNRFCFGCQQGTPVVNRSYELTASDPALSRAEVRRGFSKRVRGTVSSVSGPLVLHPGCHRKSGRHPLHHGFSPYQPRFFARENPFRSVRLRRKFCP